MRTNAKPNKETEGGKERRPCLFEGVIDGCALSIDELTEAGAYAVCKWKYEGDYAIYNLSNWQTAKFLRHGITDSRRRKKEFRALLDEEGYFIGYFRLFREETDSILLNIGLEPSHCGRGYGKKALKLIEQYVAKEYPGKKIRASVRDFNRRAVRCFLASGFETTGRALRETSSGTDIFLLMECHPKPAAEFLGISEKIPEPEAKGGSKRRKK